MDLFFVVVLYLPIVLPASFVEDTSVFPVCTFGFFVNCQVSLEVRYYGRVFNSISLTSTGILAISCYFHGDSYAKACLKLSV